MANEPTTTSSPHRNSTITLRKIAEDNWRATANLRVSPAQEGNLAQNSMSMLEAHYSEDAWMRAVYADETLVGFLMMAIWPPTDGYYIWRFMIDQRYQKLRFGRTVVGMAINYIKDHYPEAKQLGVMSTHKEGKGKVEAQHSPYEFYVKLGFRQTEEPDEDGEVMMMIDL